MIVRRTAVGLTALASLAACGPDGHGEPIAANERATRVLWTATDLSPAANVVEISLVAEAGIVEFVDGTPTSALGYRDDADPEAQLTVPGPLIEAKVGDRLVVHFRNALPGLPTTVHWHGLRLPADMDGNPMVSGAVMPGDTFEYDFVLQDAGLFWYHPHVDTDVQLESGLQGILRVAEADPPVVERERIFVLDDVSLRADGSIDNDFDEDDAMFGRRGQHVTVNGGPAGTVEGGAGTIERWRLVNTANGRYFEIARDDGVAFRVIGWDGGLVAQPYDQTVVPLAPGERVDLLVKLPAAAEMLTVSSRPVDRGGGVLDDGAQLVRVALEGPDAKASTPSTSRSIERIVPPQQTARQFVLSSKLDGPTAPVFFINDQRWPLNTAVEVRSGDAEMWEVVNDEDHHHPFHIHGLFFQVLDIGGNSPAALGWKDTVDIPPGATARLAVPYDEPGLWMYHCQIPEHAERGMMGDLLVAPR